MFESVVRTIFEIGVAYVALGITFALVFVSLLAPRMDEQAVGTGVGFRLLILPGVAALWPLFFWRWIRGVTAPPVEKNPHR
jgi:hypothetical protein